MEKKMKDMEKKIKDMLKTEKTLGISNTVFLISTLQSPKRTGMCQEAKHQWKIDTPWRRWKQGECSDPDQETIVRPGVSDPQYSKPEQVHVCAVLPSGLWCGAQISRLQDKLYELLVTEEPMASSRLQAGAGDYTTCVALPLSRSAARRSHVNILYE